MAKTTGAKMSVPPETAVEKTTVGKYFFLEYSRYSIYMLHRDFSCGRRADVIVRYPKFDGSGYLALPVLRDAEQQFVIDLDFRPDVEMMTSSNATRGRGRVELLLFSSDRDDAQFDFFSVSRLQNGQIEFRYLLFYYYFIQNFFYF